MNNILKKISITIASVALLTATTVGPTFAQSNQSNQNMNETYRVNLSPLNNSGVHGFAMIHKTDNQYTVNMRAWGLEANQTHVQHIHGFTNGSKSSCPTMAQNTDGDSTLSLAEGATTYGPVLQPLTPFQMTGSNGMETYNQTFTVNSGDSTMNVMPLGNREIVLHGKTVAANADLSNPAAGYDATLPVACGHIIPMSGNGQGNGNGNGQNGLGISISGNGAGSQNDVSVRSNQLTTTTQSNHSNVSNDVSTLSNTGGNTSSYNTGGTTGVSSGDSSSFVGITNTGGMNDLSTGSMNTGNSWNIRVNGNGSGSRNNMNLHSSSTTRVSQNNDTRVNNDVHFNANAGNNHSSFNTGGDTFVNSGSATSKTSFFNDGGMNMLSH